MKIFVTIAAALGVLLVTFGWWGTRTRAGRLRFDEMAGMIPYFSLYAGFLLLGICLVLLAYLVLKK